MNKKVLIILLVTIFLITSVGVISAAKDSDSISVKVVWNGVEDMPDFVMVDLIKDGKIVDTAKLNAQNSWKTTFKVDDGGSYEVKEKISDDYSYEISGNAKGGFVIHNKMVKSSIEETADDAVDDSDDVLGATVDDNVTGDASGDGDVISNDNASSDGNGTIGASEDNVLSDDNGTSSSNATSNSTDNSTDDSNSTDGSTDDSSDDNATDDSDDDLDDNPSDDSDKEKKTTTKTKTTTTTKIIKQTKKPVNAKTDHKNTGFPIVVLVLAVIVAIFIPLSRKK